LSICILRERENTSVASYDSVCVRVYGYVTVSMRGRARERGCVSIYVFRERD